MSSDLEGFLYQILSFTFIFEEAVLDWELNPGPPTLDASTTRLSRRRCPHFDCCKLRYGEMRLKTGESAKIDMLKDVAYDWRVNLNGFYLLLHSIAHSTLSRSHHDLKFEENNIILTSVQFET